MKLHNAWLAAAILTVATPALAQSGPSTTGAIAVPANRIVGLWEATASVRPCNIPTAPARDVRNNLLFHAGGTVTENPGGLPSVTGPSRSFGLGTWRYDPDNNRYTGMLRFDNYLNGVYTGYMTIDPAFNPARKSRRRSRAFGAGAEPCPSRRQTFPIV